MDEIRKGNDLDKFATKIGLALVNLCGNLSEVRYEATMAATRFVRSQTKEEYNVNNVLRKVKKRFTCTDNDDEEEGEIIEKKKRIETTIINEKTSNHELTSTVNVSERVGLGDFMASMFVDDDDVVFPEFEILEINTNSFNELLDD